MRIKNSDITKTEYKDKLIQTKIGGELGTRLDSFCIKNEIARADLVRLALVEFLKKNEF